MEHKEHATTLKITNLAESTPSEFVDSAATFEPSSQSIGEPPIPIPIPISINRLLPSLVQVPNQIQGGGTIYYPLPFIDPMHEHFKEHVVEDIPFYVVGSIQA